jgi:hypothetical protein
MEITIFDRFQKQRQYKVSYVAAFSPGSAQALLPCKFPEKLSPLDAEKMLHMLHNMCSFPPVFKYIKNRIPSAFLPFRLKPQELPVQALLNYIAGPSNVFYLSWKQGNSIEYCKSFRGIIVSNFTTDFIFPYDSSFAKEFIDAYGLSSWNALYYWEKITDFGFCMAENNVADLLIPMESYFIKAKCYPKLCADLQSVCNSIERNFGEQIFNWSPENNRLPLLSDYLKNLDIQRQ